MPETHDISPRRIVVSEDDDDMRALLAAALRRDGHDVAVTSDGQSLLSYLTDDDAHVVDLIIADQRMPGRTGLEVLATLRGQQQRVPFILMTACCDQVTRAEARRLGVAALLDKPFQLDELRASIRKLLP